LRNVQIDDIGNADRVGEHDFRAVIRNIADQAINHRAAIVEIDAAAQKAALARGLAAFTHGAPLGRQAVRRRYRLRINPFLTGGGRSARHCSAAIARQLAATSGH
jgi:hypothetical protein